MCPPAIRVPAGSRGCHDRAKVSGDSDAPIDGESATPEMGGGNSPKNHRGRWLTTHWGTTKIEYAQLPDGQRAGGTPGLCSSATRAAKPRS